MKMSLYLFDPFAFEKEVSFDHVLKVGRRVLEVFHHRVHDSLEANVVVIVEARGPSSWCPHLRFVTRLVEVRFGVHD